MNIARVQPFLAQICNNYYKTNFICNLIHALLKPVALNHGKKVCHCQDLDEPRLKLKWIKSTYFTVNLM